MLSLKLALRNILRNRRRSFLTMLSMGGGYALLAFSLSMSEGSYNDIIDVFTSDHTGHVQVHAEDYLQRPSLYKTIDNVSTVISNIQMMSDVLGVAPRVYGPSLAYGKDKTFPATVIGIDPELEAQTSLLKQKVTQGEYLTIEQTANGYHPAMLGATLAKNLKLNVGDELVLISQGIDGSVANDIFEVVAIAGTETSYERMNVYLSLPAMWQFLSMDNQVHELAIRLQHQGRARAFAQVLQQRLKHNSQTADLNAAPWQVVEQSFYKSMQADKMGNYISMAIIMAIVSIGVLNTILMAMLERTREFGVLRAIGTQPVTVFRLIMLESLLLSLCSCVFGVLLALPANYWLVTVGIAMPTPIDMGGISFDKMSGEISVYVMLLPALVVVCSTLLVSLFPAIRAARISPLQALQSL